jgi:endonuclease/exonuclease/phosphatase family metal-dependent hydrolase
MTFLSILTVLLITAPTETPQTIRIATYNIHNTAGTDRVVDVHRIAQLIEATEADIVCLQEVDQHVKRSKNLDIPNILADILDMHVVYDPNLTLGEGKYGNAILSRFPFIYSENIALPNPLNKEPGGCQRADIDLGDNNMLTV